MKKVNVSCWGDLKISRELRKFSLVEISKCLHSEKPVYSPREEINKKIFVSSVDTITLCQVGKIDVIDGLFLQIPKKKINITDYRKKVLAICDDGILREMEKITKLSLCDIIITKSFNFPSVKNFLHVVLPKYSSVYKTSSTSSLHLSIRNAFDQCIENNYKTVLIGKDILKPTKDFPIELSIEIIIRTIRKILEYHSEYFTKIIFSIDDEDILQTLFVYLGTFFPHDEEERKLNLDLVRNAKLTKYGDFINGKMESMRVKQDPFERVSEGDNGGYNSGSLYNDLENFDINSSQPKSDIDLITSVFNPSTNFAKWFYFTNKKKYFSTVNEEFDKIGAISYKGTDSTRQIFFYFPKKINFTFLSQAGIENDYALYLYNYISTNYQEEKSFSLIIFCDDLSKDNYPPLSMIETLQKMGLSYSSIDKLGSVDIVLLQPDIMLKMYYQFIKVNLNSEISKKIRIMNEIKEFNTEYYLGVDEEMIKRLSAVDISTSDAYAKIETIKTRCPLKYKK